MGRTCELRFADGASLRIAAALPRRLVLPPEPPADSLTRCMSSNDSLAAPRLASLSFSLSFSAARAGRALLGLLSPP